MNFKYFWLYQDESVLYNYIPIAKLLQKHINYFERKICRHFISSVQITRMLICLTSIYVQHVYV